MAITLDGNSYKVRGTAYRRTRTKAQTFRRTLTGAVDHVDAGYFDGRYRMTLICASADVDNLLISYAKTAASGASLNRLTFTDEAGRQWNAASSGTGILNTGVFISSPIDPVPVQESGFGKTKWLCDLELIISTSAIDS